jgi:uncharacterized protein (DUF1786 family)
MKILAVDIGTGTQDIFLFDSNLDIENGFKMVLPSPTMMINRRLRQATRLRQPVLLTGVTMGGGPSGWAAEDHARAGLPIYATPDAARTFNDDLAKVQEMGITLISEDEITRLPAGIERLELRDFDFAAIQNAFSLFGVSLSGLSAVAVAVFDHGAAPADVSDRKFRFDYLDDRIRCANRLSAFAYPSDQIPPAMTRLQAVHASARGLDVPLVVMDTAPAAVLGATLDPLVSSHPRALIANVGNFHTLAFRLGPQKIEGVFEHHTGFLNQAKLEHLLVSLADGSLANRDVFDDMGHGALVYGSEPLPMDNPDFNVIVTGPRRSLLRGSTLKPYFSAPFGDMMMTGCFGLLAAAADCLPELRQPILSSLAGSSAGTAPWDVD